MVSCETFMDEDGIDDAYVHRVAATGITGVRVAISNALKGNFYFISKFKRINNSLHS